MVEREERIRRRSAMDGSAVRTEGPRRAERAATGTRTACPRAAKEQDDVRSFDFPRDRRNVRCPPFDHGRDRPGPGGLADGAGFADSRDFGVSGAAY